MSLEIIGIKYPILIVRSSGIGTKLLKKVVQFASDNECKRVVWSALEWNTLAREFYQKISREMSDPLWITYHMTSEHITNFLRE